MNSKNQGGRPNYSNNNNDPNRRRPRSTASRRPMRQEKPMPMKTNKARRNVPVTPPPPKPKTPAWKVLLTVVIIILCMALVIGTAVFAMGGFTGIVDIFFKPETPTEGVDTPPIIPDANREEGTFNFLVAGLNADLGNNTDTLMLIKYDVAKKNINIVQIPRDTYIDAGYNFHKINSVFASAYNAGSGGKSERRVQGMEGAPDMPGLKEFIEKAYSVRIDYYALIDLDAFQSFIDRLGGLRVNVPCRMQYNDPEQDLYIDLQPGMQTLSGYDAMCMVRNRKTYSDADYGRMDAQKIVLSALLKQIKEDMDVNTLTELIRFSFDSITTNIPLDDCIYFGTHAMEVDLSALNMVTMPTTSYGGYITTLETGAVEVINKYLNVYDRPITAEDFDNGNRLTSTKNRKLYETYLYETVDINEYTGENTEDIKFNVWSKK